MDQQLEVLKLEINKLEVKPGELLAIKFPEGTHLEGIDYFADKLKELLPDGVGVIFLEGDVELFMVSKEDGVKASSEQSANSA